LAKTWLKPPPEAIQPISRALVGLSAAWQFTGGLVVSTLVPVLASVHR